jgi:hypothetical protein
MRSPQPPRPRPADRAPGGLVVALLLGAIPPGPCPAQEDGAARIAFFERQVRPLLADRCQRCHGPDQQKSGLRLDHGEHIRRGGARGPALVPGEPDASRLWRAVGYEDVDLQMPPDGRLAAGEIEVLRRWIAEGAVWPDEPLPETRATAAGFDLEARAASHWCWNPPVAVEPPALAGSRYAGLPGRRFAREPIDRFVAARLAAAGLDPAAPAPRAVWLRRVSFDLGGLPPTAEELAAFEADPRADLAARAAVVDRLLAAPAFGERFARHWLDLVRYAETMGHEFDFPMVEPWRYRDYLIRAFAADLPYDQLIVEHLAGDLLEEPRRDPATGLPESPLGTAFLWFMDQTHSPVDSRQALSERIDNAIDVSTKTFLGLTVACARCHDHKFDAIATTDYYALFGVLESSRYLNRVLEPEGAAAAHAAARALRARAVDELLAAVEPGTLAPLLRAAAACPAPPPPAVDEAERSRREDGRNRQVAALAAQHGVEPGLLARFDEALRREATALEREDHPLWSFAALLQGRQPSAFWAGDPGEARPPRADRLLFDPADPASGSDRDGHAFTRAADPTTLTRTGDALRLQAWPGWFEHSALGARRAMGSLATADFRIDARYLHVEVAGEAARFNVVVNGFHLIRDPIYGPLKQAVDHPDPRWRTVDLGLWRGERAYLQFVDVEAHDPADPHRGGGYDPDGWLAVGRALLSDAPTPPRERVTPPTTWLGKTPPDDLDGLSERYAEALAGAVQALRAGRRAEAQAVHLCDWLGSRGLLPGVGDAVLAAVGPLLDRAEDALPAAAVVGSTCDGPGLDARVHIRGSHRQLGEAVPRRDLLAFGGDELPGPGSGRLALARAIADPAHPLTARVAVNRLWHHMFGRGLVPTVDNFGVLGEPPSHPELLDWLALRFVADGWSIKALLRRIALSETYAMASGAADPAAAGIDPENVLLHEARVRRLDGEALRDALLAISGRLDPRRFGPPVPVHLTPFMDGRGRPGRSGPRDGDGRRSIYLEVRRNFLDPLFLAFDTPIPFSTVGARSVSNVPAQALALMNDPLVHELGQRWADRVLALELADDAARIERMYREAYARSPDPGESAAVEAFVRDQTGIRGGDRRAAFGDLAHVLLNVKEFLFLR